MTEQKSTFEQRISDYNGLTFKDPFTPEERLAILELSNDEFEDFNNQVMKPLANALETMSWEDALAYKNDTLKPIIQSFLK